MSQFTVSQTVQSMIDCNCPMVFYYTHSKPELKRIAHPILIVGKKIKLTLIYKTKYIFNIFPLKISKYNRN